LPIALTVQAHWLRRARPEFSGLGSAKADQNPSVLRTPGILENVPECSAKPNCFCNFMKKSALAGLRAKTCQNIVAKRNLVPPLRALLPLQSKLSRKRPQCGTSFSAALATIKGKK